MKCLQCGKEITSKTAKKFCCKSCATIYNNLHRRTTTKGKMVSRPCIKCGKNCEVSIHTASSMVICDACSSPKQKRYRSLISTRGDNCLYCGAPLHGRSIHFCCNEHKNSYYYEEYIAKWKAGEVDGVAGKDAISRHIKRYMRDKHNNRCEKCGWGEINPSSGTSPLSIHHINGDCHDNREENLQLLCPNCHSLTENYCSLNKNCTRTTNRKY